MKDWIVQSNVLNNVTICIILYNVVTFQCIIRYFRDEVEAHMFFTDVIHGSGDPLSDEY